MTLALCLSALKGFAFEDETAELVLHTSSGESVVLEIAPEESFRDVMSRLNEELSTMEEHFQLDSEELSTLKREVHVNYRSSAPDLTLIAKRWNGGVRNYLAPLTPTEKADVDFILNSLARESLKKLHSLKSSLKKAGVRIDHLHPLRFMYTVFTDEKLKVSIAQMQDRSSWIWKEFIDGVVESFEKEHQNGNIKPEYIADFLKAVPIDPALVQAPLNEKRWKDFILTLIKHVPRAGNTGRYDM